MVALGDPFQIILIILILIAIPIAILYWLVRLAVRAEMKRHALGPASGQGSESQFVL